MRPDVEGSIMRRSLSALVFVLAVALPSAVLASLPVDTSAVPQFSAEAMAQKHCPGDTVVWLNTYSGIWHYKGAK